jgi:hypothetical protein
MLAFLSIVSVASAHEGSSSDTGPIDEAINTGPTINTGPIDETLAYECTVDATISIGGTSTGTGTGTVSCNRDSDVVKVTVWLYYNGVPVDKSMKFALDESSVTTTVEFICLPGVWWVTAYGSGKKANGPATSEDLDTSPVVTVIEECAISAT